MHYAAEAALQQKVETLDERSETQARDVFDLDLLLRRQPPVAVTAAAGALERAAERALELPFSAFTGQVLPFLDPEIADLYDEDAWLQIQTFVAQRLLEAR